MTTLVRWRGRLAVRRTLLKTAEARAAYWRKAKAKAKRGTAAYSHAGALLAEREAAVRTRRSQVAYAERVVARYSFATSVSPAGLALITRFEGERLTAYKPVPGEQFYTIGVGHYGADVKAGQRITHARAMTLLRADAAHAVAGVNALGLHLTQGQFDALVSIAFNCGVGVLGSGSTLGAALRKHDMAAASRAFDLYVNGANGRLQGLVDRRAAERKLFDS